MEVSMFDDSSLLLMFVHNRIRFHFENDDGEEKKWIKQQKFLETNERMDNIINDKASQETKLFDS